MTDSMGLEKLVRNMQNLSYTFDDYLICIGLGLGNVCFVPKLFSQVSQSIHRQPLGMNGLILSSPTRLTGHL